MHVAQVLAGAGRIFLAGVVFGELGRRFEHFESVVL